MENQKITFTPRKKRSRNFSIDEENVIQSMVEANWSVLTEKHSSEVTKKRKNNVWSDIAREVNAKGVAPRSLAEVKEKWTNMTRKAKKTYTDYRIQAGKTGGGPPPPEPSQATSRIIDIMRDSASFDGVPDGLETECINIQYEATLPTDSGSGSEAVAPTPTVETAIDAPAEESTSQTSDAASPSTSPFTSQTTTSATLRPQTLCRVSQGKAPASQWTRKEPSSSEKVLHLQQQVLSGELNLQQLQEKKLRLQIKLLESLDSKNVSEEMTTNQILMSLVQ